MKARIEKKVSNKLAKIAPKLFHDAWIDGDVSELAWEQGVRVSHVASVGGGLDYWGEGQDAYTCLESMKLNWHWVGDFEMYGEDHEFYVYPNTKEFKPTTRNLIKLARQHG